MIHIRRVIFTLVIHFTHNLVINVVKQHKSLRNWAPEKNPCSSPSAPLGVTVTQLEKKPGRD